MVLGEFFSTGFAFLFQTLNEAPRKGLGVLYLPVSPFRRPLWEPYSRVSPPNVVFWPLELRSPETCRARPSLVRGKKTPPGVCRRRAVQGGPDARRGNGRSGGELLAPQSLRGENKARERGCAEPGQSILRRGRAKRPSRPRERWVAGDIVWGPPQAAAAAPVPGGGICLRR